MATEASRQISYTRSDDSVGALAVPDFSQAFTSNKLGDCLCITNPMQEKFCGMAVDKLERERLRRQTTLQYNQKSFFVKQIFEKGLNPYLRPSTTRDEEDMTSPTKGMFMSVSAPTTPRDRRTPREKWDEKLPMVRSHTLGTLHHQDRSEEAVFGTSFLSANREHVDILPPINEKDVASYTSARAKTLSLPLEPPSSSRFGLPPLQEEPEAKDSTEGGSIPEVKEHVMTPLGNQRNSDRLYTPQNRKRRLSLLKKNPENIYPKMNFILEHGASRLPRNTDDTPSSRASSRDVTVPKLPQKADEKENGVDYVKMIQKLTAYLPENLQQSAKSQIRQMTNSEAIYEQKQRLLKRNTDKMKLNTRSDPRWQKLERSLCPTWGMGGKWRKSADRWQLVRDK